MDKIPTIPHISFGNLASDISSGAANIIAGIRAEQERKRNQQMTEALMGMRMFPMLKYGQDMESTRQSADAYRTKYPQQTHGLADEAVVHTGQGLDADEIARQRQLDTPSFQDFDVPNAPGMIDKRLVRPSDFLGGGRTPEQSQEPQQQDPYAALRTPSQQSIPGSPSGQSSQSVPSSQQGVQGVQQTAQSGVAQGAGPQPVVPGRGGMPGTHVGPGVRRPWPMYGATPRPEEEAAATFAPAMVDGWNVVKNEVMHNKQAAAEGANWLLVNRALTDVPGFGNSLATVQRALTASGLDPASQRFAMGLMRYAAAKNFASGGKTLTSNEIRVASEQYLPAVNEDPSVSRLRLRAMATDMVAMMKVSGRAWPRIRQQMIGLGAPDLGDFDIWSQNFTNPNIDIESMLPPIEQQQPGPVMNPRFMPQRRP